MNSAHKVRDPIHSAAAESGAQSKMAPDNQGQSLEDLMAGYQNADDDAASQFVRRLSPALLRFFSAPGVTKHYAEDLLQELWLRVHKARHSYQPGKRVMSWIFTIAHNTRVDAYRRLRRKQASSIEQAGELTDRRSDPKAFDYIVDFRTLAAKLSDGQRETIVMLKVRGMTLEEVALATGTTVGGVKQKAHRAYRRLRSMAGGVNGVRALGR